MIYEMFYKNKCHLESLIVQTKRYFFYSSKKGINIETIAKLQRPYDLSISGFFKWLEKREKDNLIKNHSYNQAMVQHFGVEVAAAKFILNIGGKIKIKNSNEWISDAKLIPSIHLNTLEIEVIDVQKTEFMFNSFENIKLTSVQYLNLSYCPNIDDWCMDRLILYRSTLLYLDISGCENITERGIATLHRFKRLKRLKFRSMAKVRDVDLLQLLLEEQLPQCYIETDANSTTEDAAMSNSSVETILEDPMKGGNATKRSFISYLLNLMFNSDTRQVKEKLDGVDLKDKSSSLGSSSSLWINDYLKRYKA